jgi:hypothetical protein
VRKVLLINGPEQQKSSAVVILRWRRCPRVHKLGSRVLGWLVLAMDSSRWWEVNVLDAFAGRAGVGRDVAGIWRGGCQQHKSQSLDRWRWSSWHCRSVAPWLQINPPASSSLHCTTTLSQLLPRSNIEGVSSTSCTHDIPSVCSTSPSPPPHAIAAPPLACSHAPIAVTTHDTKHQPPGLPQTA